jgi:transcriptional regulator with GAF, ATPase, and Fis domain
MNAIISMTSGSKGIADRDPLTAVAHRHAVASGSLFLVDTSAALLRTIAEVLDIRRVFPRVSEIVRHALPHDALELVFHDRSGRVTLEARSIEDLAPAFGCAVKDDEAFYIVSDLRRPSSRLARSAPPAAVDTLLAAGYRSVLNVRTVARDQVMRLGFFSKHADAYGPDDVPTAQHIADYVAVAVAHEQLAAAERDRAEARGRAERVDARVRTLADTGGPVSTRGRMIGRSDAWRRVLAKALRVAPTETTVFLQGASGTGKEVVARFIHQASPRKDGPFVPINCAALPEQLLESELFGYERGAFTGAQQAKAGQIELAARGVLFLDEVSEMSLAAQAKFLRFLQEREFQRLGGTRIQKANVRVVAASNRDLRQAVEQGTFREDLFYRLQVFDISLPPLRDRLGDVPLLAEQFLQELGEGMSRRPARLSDEARDWLLSYSWPGNVRELRNVLERAAILSDDGVIDRCHLSLHARTTAAAPPTDLGAIERQTIEAVLRETDGNKSKAARRLGLTRTQLYVRLRRHGIENAETV